MATKVCLSASIVSLRLFKRNLNVQKCVSSRYLSRHPVSDRRNEQENFDTLGTWDNRIDLPLLLQASIKHGKPIPKISVENVGINTVIGRRTTNEDRFKVKELQPELLYFAVFDGHGGSECADFCSEQMEDYILYWLGRGEKDLETILQYSFQDVNNVFARHVTFNCPRKDASASGTTATVCLLRNSVELVIGHVGDSRALLCRNGETRKLTTDHSADLKSEKHYVCRMMMRSSNCNVLLRSKDLFHQFTVDMYSKIGLERVLYIRLNQRTLRVEQYAHLRDALMNDRNVGIRKLKNTEIAKLSKKISKVRVYDFERILKSGGTIEVDNLGRHLVNGRLAMTRSLGDFDLKPFGVTAQPDTRFLEIKHGRDAFLILTTDGVNFSLNDQEICDAVNTCHDPAEAAGFVTDQALQFGSDDNATAVIVPFGAWGKYQNRKKIALNFGRSLLRSNRY